MQNSGVTRRTSRARLAKLRHDMRTPVNAIIGYSEMLLVAPGLDTEDREDLGKITQSGARLQTLIDEFLSDARLSEGEHPKVDADGHFRLREQAATVTGYADLLRDKHGESPLIANDLERIRFAGAHLTQLVDKLTEGAVLESVESLAPDESDLLDAALKSMPALSSEPAQARFPGHLLVVDSNKMSRDILVRQLRSLGYYVTATDGGQNALDMLPLGGFDLVLLDVIMPPPSGYAVLESIRADSRYQNLPVAMISALDEMDAAVRCLEAGAEDYLSKSSDPVMLRARIDALLEKKLLRDHEIAYLRDVAILTGAAAAVSGERAVEKRGLGRVAERDDNLGELARVFNRMVAEIAQREKRLKREIKTLKLEVDEERKNRDVMAITESDYFQSLKGKLAALKKRG
ncbi:MAG: response regulator [Gammaproteobacteria bacterium]|nr:response regulator [Gammaproteobacteria bacterium]